MTRRLFPVASLAKAWLALASFLLTPTVALAGALTPIGSLPASMRQQVTGLYVKGASVNTWYALEVDPTTGNLPISFGGDQNYGVVGANTLRVASQIGNATGAADFGHGAVSAQTLRTVSVLSNGTAALATGAGTAGTTVLRVVLPTDQTAIPATQSGTWNIGTLTSITNPVAVTGTFWQATQPVSAASLPLPTGAATSALQTTGNTTLSAISGQLPTTLGAKTTANSLAVTVASDQTVPVSMASAPGTTGRTKCLLARYDYSGGSVGTGAYVQLVASTTCDVNRVHIFDSSGSAMKISVGGAGSEVDQIYLPPGGSGTPYELRIPSGSRIAIEALDTTASVGQLIMTGLN